MNLFSSDTLVSSFAKEDFMGSSSWTICFSKIFKELRISWISFFVSPLEGDASFDFAEEA